MRRAVSWWGPGLVVALAVACSSEGANDDGSMGDGASGDDAATGHDGDAYEAPDGPDEAEDAGRGEPDAELPSEPGPLTFLVAEAEVITDRLCDHDGDGVADNALADLGPSNGPLFAAALSSQLQGGIEEGIRIAVHFPWLDDRVAPDDREGVMITYEGEDPDHPDDPTDDFSGEEPMWVDWRSLDACGEPRFVVEDVRVERGALEGSGGAIAVPLRRFLRGENPHVTGTIGRGGRGASLEACGYLRIHEAGGEAGDGGTSGELSQLEEILGGGQALGIPTLPGLTPDVDLDGDGLERFETDETFAIEACVDGDATLIAGRDCWRDERMADAFAVAIRYELLPALFGGRLPSWEGLVQGDCSAGPPERSLFDPPPDAE